MPARYRTNNIEYSNVAGTESLVLTSDPITNCLICNTHLPLTNSERQRHEDINPHELPIDDPDAQDPVSIAKAEKSEYWDHWLGAIYEELAALAAKGVYEEVDALPAGQKPVDSK